MTVLECRAKLIGVASLLLCVAFASEALTLGRIRGATLIGQPLNMVVPVQISGSEDASASCFEADVFHADARQDPSRVRVVAEPTGLADTVNIRILSSATVNEPVVTVYLRTVCEQKTTRRYVLLADFPSEVTSATAPSQSSVVPSSSSTVTSVASGSSGGVVAAEGQTNAVSIAPETVAQPKAAIKPKPALVKKAVKKPVKKAVAPQPAATTPVTPTPADAPSGQPRLVLDSPLLLSDQADALALTPAATPSAETQRDQLKIATLESDVKALVALAAKNEASLLEVRSRLQVAESERLPSWIVYALGALLLACLVVIALLLRRQRQVVADDNSRWSASVAAAVPPPMPPSSPGQKTANITMPSPIGPTAVRQVPPAERPLPVALAPAYGLGAGASTQMDVNLLEMSESGFDNLMQSGVAHSAIRKPKAVPAPAIAEPHSLNSSSVFDVRQQAEFFVSLGQTDQAVRILEKHISESDDPNPHVYLDLLAIFHSLSLKVDFRQFREDFNLLFNSRIPEFAAFKVEGQELEAYPAALESISAAWPSSAVLGVIESLVFRDPLESGSQPFDLAALRDLLLLHAVAQRIVFASMDNASAGLALGGGAAAHAKSKPYFADSSLSMPLPLPMPPPYASAADARGLDIALDVSENKEVDVDLDLSLDNVELDLDLSADPGAGVAPAAAQDSELDISLPLSEPMDFELPSANLPYRDNLIDFDMPAPVLRPNPDNKPPSTGQ